MKAGKVIIILTILSICCAGCQRKENTGNKEGLTVENTGTATEIKTETTTENPSKTGIISENDIFSKDETILFIDSYVNAAWAYTRTAKVITNKGRVYTVDYSDDERNGSICDIILQDGIKQGGSKVYSEEEIKEMYGKLIRIDESKRVKSDIMCCDAGSYDIYGFIYNEDGSYNMINVIEDGDENYYYDDANAKDIVLKIWKKESKIRK